MNNKYLNEAIIGNDDIVISFSKKGELLRLFYPTRDCRQFVDTFYTGVKVNDSNNIYLHDDINNIYDQYYSENTNVLNTKIENTYFKLDILQTDFVSVKQDVIIKKYIFTNNNSIDLNINFLVYSKLLSSFNNMVGTKIDDNIFMQYSHNYTFCIFSKTPILSYKLNNSEQEIKSGVLEDKDFVAMQSDSAVSFDLGKFEPGQTKEFELFIYINSNRDRFFRFDDIEKDVNKIRKMNVNTELEQTKKYWRKYVKEHDGLRLLDDSNIEEITEDMKRIYARSILLFPLLLNSKTGGISAALEVDEKKDKSGRYSYCWPRDAVFINRALELLNMNEEVEKFYKVFSKNTQSNNGMWEQRFYTDCKLAPCWGYQIDETASIIYGVYEHYIRTRNLEFLKDTVEMCEKAIGALKKYIDNVVYGKNNEKGEDKNNLKDKKQEEFFSKHESYDLWENYEGIHLYSMSAIYSAFDYMARIYRKLEKDKKIDEMQKYAKDIKQYCLENLCDKESATLKRNNKDNYSDVSVLATVVPFKMMDLNDKEIKNTVEKINLTLRTYTGGYLRYENDSYLGGKNPWPIATLWMAIYYLRVGNREEAQKCIDFVTNTATKHGLLAEQIDNSTMQSKWVIGLGWSHAMYVITLSQLGTVPN